MSKLPNLNQVIQSVGTTTVNLNQIKAEPYSYKNIFFIAASSDREIAQEIQTENLPYYETIDNKPHGVFTNALLMALHGKISVDKNRDGNYSFGELYQATRSVFQKSGKYQHTPSRLPTLAEDDANLGERMFLATNLTSAFHPPLKEDYKVDSSQFPNIQKLLASIHTIHSKKGPHLRLVKNKKDVLILNGAGEKIRTLFNPTDDELIKNIRIQKAIYTFLNENSPESIGIEGGLFRYQENKPGSRLTAATAFIQNEKLSFSVKSSENAYLAIFHVDSAGNMSMHWPENLQKEYDLKRNQRFERTPYFRVQPPQGRDIVRFVAFKEWPSELNSIIGHTRSFSIFSDRAQKIFNVLRDDNIAKGVDTFEFYTKPAQ